MTSLLAATILLGRSAGPASLGDLSLVLATVAILQAVSIGGISGAALHKMVVHAGDRTHLVRTIVAARLLLVPATFLIAVLVLVVLLGRGPIFAAALGAAICGYGIGAFDVAEIYRNSKSQYSLIAGRRSLLVALLFPVKCLAAWKGSLEGVLIVQGVEAAMWQVVLLPRFVEVWSVLIQSLSQLRAGAAEVWELRSLWLSGITAVLSTRSDIYVIATLVGVAQLGQYTTASRFVEAASIVAVAVTTVVFNDLARSANLGSNYAKTSRSAARQVLGLSTSLTVLLAIAGPFLIELLYGDAFKEAAQLVPLYAITLIPLFQRQLISKILVVEKRYTLSLFSNVVGLGLNVALNLILVPHLELWGAVLAAILSYTLTILVVFLPTEQGRRILAISVWSIAMSDERLTNICNKAIKARRENDDESEVDAPKAGRVEAGKHRRGV
ncbi:lipopolysaccharide biosynthesis protein [Williamsia limnetica]|uniref:lipopolysaccharide biosynthesis protein n=1 Tax=Williamsia limnetica TaxID=882452 RepID=UPI000D7CBA5A|nr:lipid II flippase MurJ [Williamsia limnetica]